MVGADSSKATSDDLKKQIMEQTSKLAEEPEVEETQEVVEAETEESEESTEEETTSEEKVETSKEKPEKKEELHKIIVEGKEEELPYEKMKEYAQKGRYLEREMAKLKAERETIKTGQQQTVYQTPQDFSKINEQFVENLQKDTFGTMVQFYQTARNLEKQQEQEQKRLDKEFESDKRELPHYKAVKPFYDEFKDLGHSRETAWAMAEADFWKDYAFKMTDKTRAETEKKVRLQKKAEMPVGEKKTKETTSLPSDKDLSKMTSAEIKKYLKYVKHPDW